MSEKKVDMEWKKRAQKEKEALAKEPAEGAPRGPATASIGLIVSSFTAQALIALGQIPNPLSRERRIDLEAAKFSIDLLQILEDKTKGNLTDDEKKMLSDALYDLRMQYVQISDRVGGL